MPVTAEELLEMLGLEGLRKAAGILELRMENFPKKKMIAELAARKWNSKEFEELVEITRKDMEGRVRVVSNTIFSSDELSGLGAKDVIDLLSKNPVDFDEGEYSGFEILKKGKQEVIGKYWYESRKLIMGEKTVHAHTVPTGVEFRILFPKLVFIKTSKPHLVNSCKKKLQDALGVSLTPAIKRRV